MAKTAALIESAKKAGLQIIPRSDCTAIRIGRADGCRVYADGTILRECVRLDLATRMTVAQARQVLRLPASA